MTVPIILITKENNIIKEKTLKPDKLFAAIC